MINMYKTTTIKYFLINETIPFISVLVIDIKDMSLNKKIL